MDWATNLLPKSSRPLLLPAIAVTTVLAIPVLYLSQKRLELTKRVHLLPPTCHECGPNEIISVPPLDDEELSAGSHLIAAANAYNEPTDSRISKGLVLFRERVWTLVPLSDLSLTLSTPDLLLAYIRHNMTLFSNRTPQGWLMRLMAPSVYRHTFDRNYLAGSNFEIGDVICGVYRVEHRSPTGVELKLLVPPSHEGKVNQGFLYVTMRVDDGFLMVQNDVYVYRRKDEPKTILEGWLGAWAHGIMAMWLMDQGVAMLKQLKSKEEKQ